MKKLKLPVLTLITALSMLFLFGTVAYAQSDRQGASDAKQDRYDQIETDIIRLKTELSKGTNSGTLTQFQIDDFMAKITDLEKQKQLMTSPEGAMQQSQREKISRITGFQYPADGRTIAQVRDDFRLRAGNSEADKLQMELLNKQAQFESSYANMSEQEISNMAHQIHGTRTMLEKIQGTSRDIAAESSMANRPRTNKVFVNELINTNTELTKYRSNDHIYLTVDQFNNLSEEKQQNIARNITKFVIVRNSSEIPKQPISRTELNSLPEAKRKGIVDSGDYQIVD